MLERILTATDFSPAGARALQAALRWAVRTGAALRVVHAIPPRRRLDGLLGGTRVRSLVTGRAAAALKSDLDALQPPADLEISSGIVEGTAARAILREANAFRADLLVVGARGERDVHGMPQGLGATAHGIMRSATVPVLLVRTAPTDTPPIVIAAVDLGAGSAAVVRWAALASGGAPVHVLNAFDVPYAERLVAYGMAESTIDVYSADEHARRERELAELARAAGEPLHPGSTTRVERGDAARRLYELARAAGATCAVVGTHAPHPFRRPATGYGSVCRYATEHLPCDVLVVPPGATPPPRGE